jgi:hypothetical protein
VGAGADGVGVGVAAGVGDALGVGATFFGFGFFCAGSEPDGVYDTTCGAAATEAGFTADGAAVVLLLLLALPMPNAAPNAIRAATTPAIVARWRFIRGTSRACGASTSRGSGS